MALLRKNVQLLFSKFTHNAAPLNVGSRLLHSSETQRQVAEAAEIERPQGKTKCTLIPGDGIGPELLYCVQEVFKAADVPVEFETFFFSEVHAGMSAPLEQVAGSIHRNGVCLKGTLATPDYSHTGELQSLNMKLRQMLDVFANVVHVKSWPGIKLRHEGIDAVIIREQTEGEYSALEHETVPGVVECLKIVTAAKSERIAKFAFDYATKFNRKKVTAVHKANIMKLGDGLFLRSCQDIAKMYPKIQFEAMIVDNCTMQMVSHPQQFDVLVMPNLYGSILDNLASGLVGGAGCVAGASYSAESVVFEPGARHTYSEAVGKNVANPTAMLLCGAKMLQHVNLQYYSDLIRNALAKVYIDGKVKTKDLGGQSTTKDLVYAIINNLGSKP
ncbi:Isocitrate dehydrogenase [Nesidiocoris tenuis]|uniref:Isocitric dehydrogenase subunit beta n=1 Tax=Nesidiocoris tenuis TaxID=355587 RepID=A0ABN7B012_9HEMI|nr:Isocitrate dehydrogenase [Nesidiocoris tenuis]